MFQMNEQDKTLGKKKREFTKMEISNDHKGAHQTWEKNGLNPTKR